MRILLVSEDLPGAQVGGLGKHVVTLGNALLARGHVVRILGRNDCGPEAAPRKSAFAANSFPASTMPIRAGKKSSSASSIP